jgi:hypothetical protein
MAKSTTDLTISCAQTGTAFAADVTQALIAINSAHRSSTEPTYNLEDGVMWLDTSSSDYKLKMRIGGAWKVIVDLNAGVFETLSEAGYITRLDNHDDQLDGTTQCSPDLTALEINGSTVTASVTELNYLSGVTGNIQEQIDQKNGYVHPTTSGWKHIPSGGSADQVLVWSADGVAQWQDAIETSPGAGTVGQTELKTTTGTFSVTSEANYVTVTLPGGEYGFLPQFKTSSGSSGTFRLLAETSSTTYGSYCQMRGTLQGRQTYVTASPPYNLGDGDIPLFVFLEINENNEVKSVYASITPPWAYNGPTSIVPDYYDENGVGWQQKDGKLIEVDYDLKNADMELIPHPFADRDGVEVILLNPFNENIQVLIDKLENKQEVCEYITDNLLIKDDSSITTPPRVRAVDFEWSN